MNLSFPFEDPTVVVEVKGQALLQALENGVCHYPALEGMSPCFTVSAASLTDPYRPLSTSLEYSFRL